MLRTFPADRIVAKAAPAALRLTVGGIASIIGTRR
jgi:hypothetical protein